MQKPIKLRFYPTVKVLFGYSFLCNLIGAFLINIYSRFEMIYRLTIKGNEDFRWQMLNIFHINFLIYIIFFWAMYLVPAFMIGFALIRQKFYLYDTRQTVKLFMNGFLAILIWFCIFVWLIDKGTFNYYFNSMDLGFAYAVIVNGIVMGASAVILGKFILPTGD